MKVKNVSSVHCNPGLNTLVHGKHHWAQP